MRRFAIGALLLVACGDAGPEHVLAPDAEVPSLYEDEATASLIDAHDGVERTVGRVSAFVHGGRVWYWLFGEVSDTPMPAYVLCRQPRPSAACAPVDHPHVVEAIPGEEGYSPYGRIHRVPVTDRWQGERLPSVQAIREAVDAGLVEEPQPQLEHLHCPIVHPDVRVEVADDGTTVEPGPVYVRGREARCFDFTAGAGLGALVGVEETVRVRNVYVLTRDGEDAPLAETLRGEDLTGDGDTVDTNNVFGAGLGDVDYTPLWRMVRVTVPSDYASIDTSGDELVADYTSSDEMFTVDDDYEITPIPGRVVAHELTDALLDCPLQSAPGSL